MQQRLQIPETLKVISDCWQDAELETSESVGNMPFPYEETITNVFCCKMKGCLDRASQDRRVESAFLEDLRQTLYYVDGGVLAQFSEGLVADLSFHNKSTEEKTGGDFGLVIIRPQIDLGDCRLEIKDYKRGLLCQAKRRAENGRWNKFTKSQRTQFPEVSDFYSLVLYTLDSKGSLDPFRWQLCQGSNLDQVEQWFQKKNKFPSARSSAQIIDDLGSGVIGTDDENVISEKISVAGNPVLQLWIGWPKGPEGVISLGELLHGAQNQNEVNSQVVLARG